MCIYPRLNHGNWDAEAMREKLYRPCFTYDLTTTSHPNTFTRRHLNSMAQLVTFMVLYNIRPHSHTSSIIKDTTGLVYCILKSEDVDISRIISNELKRVSLNGTRFGVRSKCWLIFLGLIMGLCKRVGVRFPSGGNIPMDGVTDEIFANCYCLEDSNHAGLAGAGEGGPPVREVPVAVASPVMPQLGDVSDWN